MMSMNSTNPFTQDDTGQRYLIYDGVEGYFLEEEPADLKPRRLAEMFAEGYNGCTGTLECEIEDQQEDASGLTTTYYFDLEPGEDPDRGSPSVVWHGTVRQER